MVIIIFKLVAIDIDGTLIDHDGNIPAYNVEVIKKLRQKDIKVILVTGRPSQAARNYLNQLELTLPILGYNGAVIRDVINDQLHFFKPLQKDIIKPIYKMFEERGLFPRYYLLDRACTFNKDEFDPQKNEFIKYSELMKTFMPYEIIEDENYLYQNEIVKLMYVDVNDSILLEMYEKAKKLENVNVFKSSKSSFEIVDKDVSKGNTLIKYANSIGIDKNQIIAIGDSENDLSMLKAAGYSITLKNGDDLLKSQVDFVTDSCENAGVGKALAKIFDL